MISALLSTEDASELLAANVSLRRMKRSEFNLLADQGCFDDERVELLFGLVVSMPPIKPPHAESTMVTFGRLLDVLPKSRASVRTQVPFAALEDSQPQPDIMVCPAGDYWTEHPEHAYLAIEIADSTVRRDRVKGRLYAQAQVDEYWIVNLEEGGIEVYRDARDGEWQTRTVHQRGEFVSPVALPEVSIAISDLLPPVA